MPMPDRAARHARTGGVFGTPEVGTGQAGATDEVVAPGLGALVRRHPQGVRIGAVGSIATGLIVFVAASLAANAGADPAAAPNAAVPSTSVTDNSGYLPAFDLPNPTSTVVVQSSVRPKHAATPAPADSAAISGLAANGIPSVALNAYRVAAARMAHAAPSCGIDWALLAGIGREESDHGRFGGAVLHADGVSTPKIIGIPLNGQGTEVIRDTDGGRIDGDPVYDRAAGPMQFIPSTWASVGTDGDGDGVANIFDINDAALTAARYLCAAGGDLRTHAGQVAAVLTYNHSDQYLAQVLALADAYRRGVTISGLPVGNTSGALPALGGGALPPASPGGPTANEPKAKAAPATKAAPKTAAKPSGTANPASGNGGGAPGATPTAGTPAGGQPTTGSSTPGAPAPTPTPTSRVCLIPDLLNPGKCAVYKS